jgi:hypothetical protein
MRRFFWLALAVLSNERTEPAPRVYDLLFVVVTDPSHPGSFTHAHYESVLRRAAITVERESLNHVQIHYSLVDLPVAQVRYGERGFLGWHDMLEKSTASRRYDILAFGPDTSGPWCTDAHSLGLSIAGKAFTCLEPSSNVALSSNVLIHKIFHTFGFFHQQMRNKQYRLLDWELGLPGYVDDEESAFFTPMALAALGILRDDSLGVEAGLRCEPSGQYECRDVTGPYRRDADHDGILDIHDGYPASPPRGGPDGDHDGIPDDLDRCADSNLTVRGNLLGGPMNYWSTDATVELEVDPAVEIRWAPAAVDVGKELGEVLTFFEEDEEVVRGSHATIPRDEGYPIRVRAAYRYGGSLVWRSFYLYMVSDETSPTPWGYFNEKEWFYFGRLGCDLPDGVDLYETRTFDVDADGIADGISLPEGYDWDGDGVPDRIDTLPTVPGSCSFGVKDSDGDGLCDPGHLVYTQLAVKKRGYFGEMTVEMDNGPAFDRCPYLPGPRASQGCPAPSWYADDYIVH